MMTEQRLRWVEEWLRHDVTHWPQACEAVQSIIDEVRRLQQAREDDTVLLGTVAGERDAAIAERDALARAVSLVEGTLKAEMDAHRRTISERDAGARHSQVVDNTHAEWVIDQWDRVGRSIMKVATGRDAVLSDSDVEGEIIRLRAALAERDALKVQITAKQRVVDLTLDEQARLRAALTKARRVLRETLPHITDAANRTLNDTLAEQRKDLITEIAAVLAQDESAD